MKGVNKDRDSLPYEQNTMKNGGITEQASETDITTRELDMDVSICHGSVF